MAHSSGVIRGRALMSRMSLSRQLIAVFCASTFACFFACGKTDPCGDLRYDSSSGSCVCPEGFTARPEVGICEGPDGATIELDGGTLDSSPDGTLEDAPLDGGDGGDFCERCGGDSCVELSRDRENCGGCRRGCNSGWSCVDGACVDVPVQLVAGHGTTCARMRSGDLYCWGLNDRGVVGVNSFENVVETPSLVEGVVNCTDVSTSGFLTCAVTEFGAVYCWGDSEFGEIGPGGGAGSRAPRRITELADVLRVATGQDHACALHFDGRVSCWGRNQFGQLGTGDTAPRAEIVPVQLGGRVVEEISAGLDTTCVRDSDGAVLCWGATPGSGSTDPSTVPVAPTGLGRVVNIAGGGFNFCGVREGGEVRCWGWNPGPGLLGTGSSQTAVVQPEHIAGVAGVTYVAIDSYLWRFKPRSALHACALREEGEVLCWGANQSGELGDGTNEARVNPVRIETEGVRQIAAGAIHTCALIAGDGIACWGENGDGRLGLGDRDDRSSPTRLPRFPMVE